jgi:hypothetical protein
MQSHIARHQRLPNKLLKRLAWMGSNADRAWGKADFDANSSAIREKFNAAAPPRLRCCTPREAFQQPANCYVF